MVNRIKNDAQLFPQIPYSVLNLNNTKIKNKNGKGEMGLKILMVMDPVHCLSLGHLIDPIILAFALQDIVL